MDFAMSLRAKQPRRRTATPTRDAIGPGWCPDPASTAHERFWTGSEWTGVVRERDLSFVAAVPGLNRTLMEKTIPKSRWSTRRINISTNSIQWGRWKLPTAEIMSVWHWIEEDESARYSDPAKAWKKLVFQAENRVSGMRIQWSSVGGTTARSEVWDAYRALVSVATTVVQPRLAVEYLDRMSAGKDVRIGSLRLTSRGIVDRHHDPRRASVSSHWDDITPLVNTEGVLAANAPGIATLRDGTPLAPVDASVKNAAVVPLLLWLAKDRFETKPLVLVPPRLPMWEDRSVG
jgi:hypothetical protein